MKNNFTVKDSEKEVGAKVLIPSYTVKEGKLSSEKSNKTNDIKEMIV